MVTSVLWTCSRCGREFGKKNQSHSCVSYSIADHFKNTSDVLQTVFETLVRRARQFGKVRTGAVKSLITISGQYHFAAVYVRKNSLTVEFALEREVADGRIERTQKLPGRVSHFVKLRTPKDVDKQLLGWLKEAYDLTAQSRQEGKPTLFKRQK